MGSTRHQKRWRSTEASKAGVVLVLLLAVGGCGLIGSSSPPPDRSEDPRIKSQVEARIAAEPSLEASQIRVEVDAGTVMLHGTTAGIGAMQCAIATAGLVEGVLTVVNYLVLQRGPRDVTCLAPRPTQ